MTVETIKRRFLYEANGTNKNYPIEFEYVDKQDVKVFTVDEYGTETEILDIYVTGTTVVVPNSAEPFPAGTKVKVERTLEYKQLDDYTQQGAFSPEDMERTADRNVMLLQQIRDVANDVEEYVEEGVGRFDEWKRDAETAAANSIAAKDTAVQAKDDALIAQGQAEQAKDDALIAQGQAEQAKDDALIAQGQAEQAKDEAESAIDKAKAWATKEDDPVEGTLFSAKYYADEVSQNTTEAQTARDEAVSAKDNAELAEGNASASAVAANTAKTDTLLAKAAAEQAKADTLLAKAAAEQAKADSLLARADSISAKTAAETAKGQAETAENKAKDWAGKTGSPVEGTLYSAKHYAESISYATQEEVNAGIVGNKVVTPATYKAGLPTVPSFATQAEVNAGAITNKTTSPATVKTLVTTATSGMATITSGSNTWGRYTRFSDGTQLLGATLSIPMDNHKTISYKRVITFPAGFNSTGYQLTGNAIYTIASTGNKDTATYVVTFNDKTATGCTIYVRFIRGVSFGEDNSPLASITIDYQGYGTWT